MVQGLIGFVIFALGVGLLIYCLRESRKGYTSVYGNDIGLYIGSIMLIIFGVSLIYRAIF